MEQITDTHGRFPNHAYDREPEPGSVVLVGGALGNAWQLYASDGLWHRGKHTMTWEQVIRERNVLLVHDAPVREGRDTVCAACGYANNHDPARCCPALPVGVTT